MVSSKCSKKAGLFKNLGTRLKYSSIFHWKDRHEAYRAMQYFSNRIGDKMEQKKVSIIVPVYNAERYLARCIDSVQRQSYHDWELLLVDDGSLDQSREICMEYSLADPRIQLFCNQHGGTARARNTALDHASGDYIAFLDADDVYHPQYLKIMVTAAEESGSMISLCKTVQGTDETTFLASNVQSDIRLLQQRDAYVRMYCGDWFELIVPYTKLYARSIFSDLRFPDGRFFEDAATIHQTILRCDQIADTNTVLYFYNVTPNSSSKTKSAHELLDREWALRSHWEFYEKENRADLVKLAVPFYLQELITIYHKIQSSDEPEMSKIIKSCFEEVYRRYRNQIVLSQKDADRILAFRYPNYYDIKKMIKKNGLFPTLWGFVRRKLRRVTDK